MGDYALLRFGDVRQVFHLLGEVREVGRDPRQWREHALRGLLRLTEANVGFSAVEVAPLAGTAADLSVPVDVGWKSPQQRQAFLDFLQGGQILADPVFPFLQQHLNQSFTCSRREIVTDGPWYKSETVQRFHRRGGCDDIIYSRRILPHLGCADMITVRGGWGERPLSARSRQIVGLFHDELARLWKPEDRGACGLVTLASFPRHLRLLVEQLSAGLNEKEAAMALGLSRHTVHAYVKELYSRVQARSRSEALGKLNRSYNFVPRLFSSFQRNGDTP